MKIINGIKHYTSTEVAKLINMSRQTVINWDKYSKELEDKGMSRLIPKPLRVGANKHRYWSKEQVKRIKFYKDTERHGDMAIFNKRMQVRK